MRHCSTLTDDQLEAMFTATDKKMQQIDKPMQCFIERTNGKVYQIFLQTNMLTQHYCEPPIKKEKFCHCDKTINCANNLKKHLKSCEKAAKHPAKQQIHQTALDGPTSSETGTSTPKKMTVEELQVGVESDKHARNWKTTEIVESAFKYTTLSLFQEEIQQQQKRLSII